MLNIDFIIENFKTSTNDFYSSKYSKKNKENFTKKLENYIKEQNEIGNVNKQCNNFSKRTKIKNEITKKYIKDEIPTNNKRNKDQNEVKDELLVLISHLLKLIDELDLEVKNADENLQAIKIEQLLEDLSVEELMLKEVIELIESIEILLPQIKYNEENLITKDNYIILEETLSQLKEKIKKDDFTNIDKLVFEKSKLEDHNEMDNDNNTKDVTNNNHIELENMDNLTMMENLFDTQEDMIKSIHIANEELILEGKSAVDEILNINEQEVVEESIELNNESKNNHNNLILEIIDKAIGINNMETNEQKLQQVDYEDVFKQIVDKVKINLENFKQEIKIKLKPEILGELLLKMEMEKGSILAKIMVDNYKTKEIIETNLYQLREDMRENGLEIKTFEVFVGTSEDFKKESDLDFNSNKKQNKSPTKLKIKNKELIEKETYMQNTLPIINELNEKGCINLLA